MHELSIALSIIDIVSQETERLGADTVHSVRVRLGPLAGVVKEALQNAFDLARESTALAATQLEIEEVPTIIHCALCNHNVSLGSVQQFYCPQCGAPASEIISGRELEIVALEIEP